MMFYITCTEQHWQTIRTLYHQNGPLTRYVKLWVVHAPGMLGTFSLPRRISDPDMHHGTCVTHVTWCMLGSLTSGFRCSWWRGKRSWHSRRMRSPQFHVSGKRPMKISARARSCAVMDWFRRISIGVSYLVQINKSRPAQNGPPFCWRYFPELDPLYFHFNWTRVCWEEPIHQ